MSDYYNAAIIICVCFIVLAIVLFKKRIEIILNFLIRGIFGTIALYLLNTVLIWMGMSATQVGINPISILTCGFLGLPGIGLLYAIMFCRLL